MDNCSVNALPARSGRIEKQFPPVSARFPARQTRPGTFSHNNRRRAIDPMMRTQTSTSDPRRWRGKTKGAAEPFTLHPSSLSRRERSEAEGAARCRQERTKTFGKILCLPPLHSFVTQAGSSRGATPPPPLPENDTRNTEAVINDTTSAP